MTERRVHLTRGATAQSMAEDASSQNASRTFRLCPWTSYVVVVPICSLIHTPPEHLHEVFAELQRVLAHEGHLLVAFQDGNGDCVHRTDAYGTGPSLTSYHIPQEKLLVN